MCAPLLHERLIYEEAIIDGSCTFQSAVSDVSPYELLTYHEKSIFEAINLDCGDILGDTLNCPLVQNDILI